MKTRHFFYYLIIGILTFSVFSSIPINAQDDEEEPSISDALKKERDEAVALKEIAEAERAALEAKLPKINADALRGSTEFKEVKGEFIETRIQGYKAMSGAVSNIVCQLRGDLGQDAILIVYKPEEAAKVQSYLSMIDAIDQTTNFYNDLIVKATNLSKPKNDGTLALLITESSKSNEGGAGFAAGAAVITEFAKLFQRKDSLSPSVFDISEKELIGEFFSQFRQKTCTDAKGDETLKGSPRFYYPGAMSFSTANFKLTQSSIWTKATNLNDLVSSAEDEISALEAAAKNWEQYSLEIKDKDYSEAREILKGLGFSLTSNAAIDLLKNDQERKKFAAKVKSLRIQNDSLRKFYEAIYTELGITHQKKKDDDGEGEEDGDSKTEDDTKPTPSIVNNIYNKESEEKKNSGGGGGSITKFFNYMEGEKLYKIMAGELAVDNVRRKGYWIQMGVSKAGGNVRVVSIPITDIFVGNRVRFSGGAVINYHIFDVEGTLFRSGVSYGYKKYRGAKKISQ